MNRYKVTIGTATKYESGKPGPLKLVEHLEQSSVEIDCLLSLLPTELIEAKVVELLGSPGYIWDEEQETYYPRQDRPDIGRVKQQYTNSILSILIGTLRSDNDVLLLLDTLTITIVFDDIFNIEVPFIAIEQTSK